MLFQAKLLRHLPDEALERKEQFAESRKERNFYYKIFCGGIFNELIPGYEERVQLFLELLEEACGEAGRSRVEKVVALLKADLAEGALYVDFDHHIHQEFGQPQADKQPDHGELADILLYGRRAFIAIEAKLYSNWSYDKDIKANRQRIICARRTKKQAGSLQVLLLTETKWQNSINQKRKPSSQWQRLQQEKKKWDRRGFILLTWEMVRAKMEQARTRKSIAPLLHYLARKTTPDAIYGRRGEHDENGRTSS